MGRESPSSPQAHRRSALMPNLFDFDAVGIQQADHFRQGEPRFAESVVFGVDGVVESCAEIRFFEVRVKKYRLQEIAFPEKRTAEVGFRKVSLVQVALPEAGVFQVQLEKGRKLQYAAFEVEFQKKGAAIAELQAKQLALPEPDILQAGVVQLRQAEIAPIESAVSEGHAGQIRIGEAAAQKAALFIHAASRVFGVEDDVLENPVLGKFCVLLFHDATYNRDNISENSLNACFLRSLLGKLNRI